MNKPTTASQEFANLVVKTARVMLDINPELGEREAIDRALSVTMARLCAEQPELANKVIATMALDYISEKESA